MIVSLDIETIPNADMVLFLPEPEVKLGNTKDPEKVAAKIAEVKKAQLDDMALDAMTGRVLSYAAVGQHEGVTAEVAQIIEESTDAQEIALIQNIFEFLGMDECRIITWNGIGFDLPFIYKRALILDVNPANFNAPPLTAWTKRYSADRHYDLAKIWTNWASGKDAYPKLDEVSKLVLRDCKTEGIDVTTFADVMKTPEGREQIKEYNLQDARLTWRLFEKMNGWLFA